MYQIIFFPKNLMPSQWTKQRAGFKIWLCDWLAYLSNYWRQGIPIVTLYSYQSILVGKISSVFLRIIEYLLTDQAFEPISGCGILMIEIINNCFQKKPNSKLKNNYTHWLHWKYCQNQNKDSTQMFWIKSTLPDKKIIFHMNLVNIYHFMLQWMKVLNLYYW